MLVKLCQIIINTYDSNSKPNKIASGLQPLLKEPEIFSDLALIKCYHAAYFGKHMAWLMQSKDLTKPAFQSHQMAVRYYLMNYDLEDLKTSMLEADGHPQF